ncbi:MAG: helix-turn-helix domain-containing protein [Acidobacteriaceae bacterium]
MNKGRNTKSAYEELGFSDAPEMMVKAQLVIKIAQILREREWTQQQAAKLMGITQPKLSKMLSGEFRGISEAKMMDCLVRLGCDVKIVVRSKGRSTARRIEVVAA